MKCYRKENVVSELKKLASQVDEIYLATDLDREGEAIARHLKEVIGGDDSRYQRVVFNEITKNAIQEAFKQPGRPDTNKVHAQQARRFLDRVVGFMISPLLWEKLPVACRRAGYSLLQSNWWLSVNGRSVPLFLKNTGRYLLIPCLKDQIRLEAVKQAGKTLKLKNKAQTDTLLEVLKSPSLP